MEDHMIRVATGGDGVVRTRDAQLPKRARRQATAQETTVYHAMPHGLHDGIRRPIVADLYINTARVHAVKRAAFRDVIVVRRSGSMLHKGWIRTWPRWMSSAGRPAAFHRSSPMPKGGGAIAHLGFCREDADPLRLALHADAVVRSLPG
jgi:hypothetical protein